MLLAQRQDEDMKSVFEYLETGTISRNDVSMVYRKYLDKLTIQQDLLKYNHHSNWITVVPAKIQRDVLKLTHSDIYAGHFGVFKTHRRILASFWWPKLYENVVQFVKDCRQCLTTKSRGKLHGTMGKREWPTKPLDCISIDFLVDLPTTKQGHNHIMVVNDMFSKYVKLYPIKDRKAPTAAKCIFDYSLNFGIPLKILSDRDPAYESELFQSLMKLFGVKKSRTSGYRPQANAVTEQMNRNIKKFLTIYIAESKIEWDQFLRELAYAYNTSVHSSTMYTPCQLFFGRTFRVPYELLYGSFDVEKRGYSFDQFVDELNLMFKIARENMKWRQDKFATYYDKKRHDTVLSEGDLVLIYQPRLKRSKLAAKWTGPGKVTKTLHPVYEIEVQTAKGTEKIWLPRDRLRKVPDNFDDVHIDTDLHGREEAVFNDTPNVDINESESEDESSDSEEEEIVENANVRRYPLRQRQRNRYYDGFVFNYLAVCEFMLLLTQIQLTCTGKIQHLLEGEEIMCYCFGCLLAIMFLYSYENEFLDKLIKEGKRKLARRFNLSYRYIDDLISFNNKRFKEFISDIYPKELTISETTESTSVASYLDLLFTRDRSNNITTKLDDKRDAFGFHIVIFPFMSSNIPSAPAYGVYASQLVRYARCCSNYSDFLIRHRALVKRLLSQGYKVNRLSNTFKKFYGRHTDLVGQYKKNVCQMFADSIS